MTEDSSMRSMAFLPLLSILALTAPAQLTEPTLLAKCRSESELLGYEAQLGRLLPDLVAGQPDAARLSALLAADAVDALAEGGPVRRVLAVRALGLSVRFTKAPPEVWQALTRACRDDARSVRAEAVRQLAQAQPSDAKLVQQARTAMLAVEEIDAGDVESLRLARALRERLEARLRERKPSKDAASDEPPMPPAAPGDPASSLLPARRNANESAAIATLRNIASAQAQTQASGLIDIDADGKGECGYFRELCGATEVRGSTVRMSPPVLSSAFAKVQDGFVLRSGYCFAVFLPGINGHLLGEDEKGDQARRVDTNQAEARWCAYAWPMAWGRSGKRVFYIDQSGIVLAADNNSTRYQGELRPDPEAALNASDLTSTQAAADTLGRDGCRWRVVN